MFTQFFGSYLLNKKIVSPANLRLALEKIAEKENFEITAEELDAEYNRLAEQYKMDVEEVKKAINDESLSADLKTQKAMDFAVDNSKTESKKSNEAKTEE